VRGRVHGLIFVSLRDFLIAQNGPEAAREIMGGEPRHLPGEVYPDEQFTDLVERACRQSRRSQDEFLREFGGFTAEKTFARLYPVLFDLAQSAREFLLTVETPIHEVVRVAMPDALPPRLKIAEIDDSGVEIEYTSPRRLCAMLQGLVEGTARHYREPVRIEERSCMRRGDGSCSFAVFFGARDALRTAETASLAYRPHG
jgi:predicted hydrocarbon binding protein